MTQSTTARTLLLAGLLALTPGLAAQNIEWYAHSDDIIGCSTTQLHQDWIEIEAIHHLWFRPEGPSSQAFRREVVLTRTMDCSTISFWEAMRQDLHLNRLTLEAVRQMSEMEFVFQRLHFDNVRIESIETVQNLDEAPVERIRFSYGQIEFASFCIDQDGSNCGMHEFPFDFGHH